MKPEACSWAVCYWETSMACVGLYPCLHDPWTREGALNLKAWSIHYTIYGSVLLGTIKIWCKILIEVGSNFQSHIQLVSTQLYHHHVVGMHKYPRQNQQAIQQAAQCKHYMERSPSCHVLGWNHQWQLRPGTSPWKVLIKSSVNLTRSQRWLICVLLNKNKSLVSCAITVSLKWWCRHALTLEGHESPTQIALDELDVRCSVLPDIEFYSILDPEGIRKGTVWEVGIAS